MGSDTGPSYVLYRFQSRNLAKLFHNFNIFFGYWCAKSHFCWCGIISIECILSSIIIIRYNLYHKNYKLYLIIEIYQCQKNVYGRDISVCVTSYE